MQRKDRKKIHKIDGIKLSSVYSGMYKKKRLDLSIIEISSGSTISGVFTKNKAKSDTVTISQNNLKRVKSKYIIVNSGNANAGTGESGYKDIIKYSNILAKLSNSNLREILVFSTGVIGERIDVDKIIISIPKLLKTTDSENWLNFSKSILTTDTVNKIISKKVKIKGKYISITGCTKGSGMINPNMATMLSFVATDIKIKKSTLSKLLRKVTEKSYNMITVDGETSTNDSSILIATGKSNIEYENLNIKEKEFFYNEIENIYIGLAKKIIKDGEGSTKFITINVNNVASKSEGKKIAMKIAKSALVKTAMFAEDPNWGRILSAVGNAETKLNNLKKITISLGNIILFKNSEIYQKYNETKAIKYLKNKNIDINIDCNNGKHNATVWTTDLSYEYIKINAEYRT